jgi:hypothetical protein
VGLLVDLGDKCGLPDKIVGQEIDRGAEGQ